MRRGGRRERRGEGEGGKERKGTRREELVLSWNCLSTDG